MLYQNWIRNFYISIGYPIGTLSKLYEDNQAKIKIVLEYRITPKVRPLDVLINALDKIHLCKKFDIVERISNMQISDINSKPHGGKILIGLIDRAI